MALLATRSAPARSAARVAGSAAAARRPAASSAITSRQPGRPGRRVFDRMRIMSGSARATTWAPRAAATSDARQLLLPDLLAGQAAQQVPVERPVGGQRHVGHQLHPVVGDRSDGRDELEGRPLVAAQGAGQGHELRRTRRCWTAPGGGPRPGGPRRATTRGRGHRRRATPPPGRTMAATWSGVGLVPGGAVAHHHPAHGRVADQEPGVDRQAARRPGRGTRRTSATTRVRRRRGPHGGSPRPPPSSPGRTPRHRVRAGRWRTRSSPRAPWSPRAGPRGWPWCPTGAGRRSGCGCRRTRGTPPCRWRRSPAAGLGDDSRRPRPARRRRPRRRPSTAARCRRRRAHRGSPGRARQPPASSASTADSTTVPRKKSGLVPV